MKGERERERERERVYSRKISCEAQAIPRTTDSRLSRPQLVLL